MLSLVQDGVSRARQYLRGPVGAPAGAHAASFTAAMARMRDARRIVDLGCGANPHPRAAVGVDAYREPVQRVLGHGPSLDSATFHTRGVQFVQADLGALPFADKEFDFAYSHHVFEHLPDPRRACAEMCRVASSGVVFTPSCFSEVAFGRPYHLWFVMARGRRLVFLRKTSTEDRPFGEHPGQDPHTSRYRATADTNPFEILLNDAGWYRGPERMSRLSRLLRQYWYSHSWVTEVTFLWEGTFDCTVIHEDGRIE